MSGPKLPLSEVFALSDRIRQHNAIAHVLEGLARTVGDAAVASLLRAQAGAHHSAAADATKEQNAIMGDRNPRPLQSVLCLYKHPEAGSSCCKKHGHDGSHLSGNGLAW